LAPIGRAEDNKAAKLSRQEEASGVVKALNNQMFGLYEQGLKQFQTKLLNESPVILGLFSGSGGRFTLYRPNKEPLVAPSVPEFYQLAKSLVTEVWLSIPY
jgi:hypothetical protein